MKEKTFASIVGKTDMGRVRKNNEDAFIARTLWDGDTYLAAAIDGVGGYEGGEIAAAIAAKTIPEYLSASANGERVELLKQAVTAANNAIFEARESDPEHGRMSCVLTAAVVDVAQKQISMVHVGDTRLYAFREGVLTKLSHDHSIVGYREEIGDLTEEEAMNHPQRNVIGRDVGSERHKVNDDDFIEARVFPLMGNTTLLLCSDGLTDMITSAAIAKILGGPGSLAAKSDALIRAALEAGGKDNVTVVLFEYRGKGAEPVREPEIPVGGDDAGTGAGTTVEVPPVDKGGEPAKPAHGKMPKALVGALVGLLVGALLVFLGMNARTKRLQKEWGVKESAFVETLSVLRDSLQAPRDAEDSLHVEQQLKIDDLQRQNDSLREEVTKMKKSMLSILELIEDQVPGEEQTNGQ